ncbi:hypothetical protein [Ornithobacterium rhinotracheale]|uniref:hypothetical protein n=1 Tax=Ornithobacterium rhinotracheale TaxID=28251 RepID=UPI001FF0FBA7|nr:hypothetical protein [Ornithobacterium rhinotracheale]MCK0199129.1 hypothetical protein [Ornithobacterium rhinotracheale]
MNIKETKKIVHSTDESIEAEVNDLVITTLHEIQQGGIWDVELKNRIMKICMRHVREISCQFGDEELYKDTMCLLSDLLEDISALEENLKGIE